MQKLKILSVLATVLLIPALIAGCGSEAEASDRYEMASSSEMPSTIQDAPTRVREGYQFAIANPEILKEIPCYCGCGAMGHTSNYSCYAQETDDDPVVFDAHALGCSICVDITQDTMRLLDEEQTLDEIQAYVDQRYAQYGPPTP